MNDRLEPLSKKGFSWVPNQAKCYNCLRGSHPISQSRTAEASYCFRWTGTVKSNFENKPAIFFQMALSLTLERKPWQPWPWGRWPTTSSWTRTTRSRSTWTTAPTRETSSSRTRNKGSSDAAAPRSSNRSWGGCRPAQRPAAPSPRRPPSWSRSRSVRPTGVWWSTDAATTLPRVQASRQ